MREVDEALFTAARYGSVYALETRLDEGADINAQNDKGDTPLIEASLYGQIETVVALLKVGANADITNKDGNTALMYAALWGYLDIMKALLDAGANPKIQNYKKRTAITFAIISGGGDKNKSAATRLLLERGERPRLKAVMPYINKIVNEDKRNEIIEMLKEFEQTIGFKNWDNLTAEQIIKADGSLSAFGYDLEHDPAKLESFVKKSALPYADKKALFLRLKNGLSETQKHDLRNLLLLQHAEEKTR